MQAIEHLVRSDIEAALNNDPATDDALEVIICYPGFKATRYHRLAHIFYRHSIPLLPRLISELAHQETGIDIHPGAQIGANFFIDHGTGVVIGETAIIGKNVTLYQGVTLGAKRFYRDDKGIVVKGNARHPVIGDGVTIYAGATILGRITIGDGSSIGGNVWLTESVPPKSRVTQQRYLSSYFTDGDGI
jgi:serine O-acetyltransferase